MDNIKKNLVSIICGVIALIAFIAYFVPLGKWVSDLQTETKQRADVYSQLQALQTKKRVLPNISIENTEQLPLTQFPSNAIIDEGSKATLRVATESKTMRDTAVAMNVHQPLIANVLPSPTDTDKFNFRDLYKEAMDTTIPSTILNAASPPDMEQLDKAAEALWKEKYKDKIIVVNGQPDPDNKRQVEAEFIEEAEKLPLKLRQETADSHQIYLSAGALTMHQPIANPAAPTPSDIWTAQLKLWVQEDVAKAIAAANAGAKGIRNSPIKHLIRITVPDNFIAGASTPKPNGEATEEAAVTGPIPKNLNVSATGRISNALYDVMQFEMEMNVDAERIPYILHKLSQNQFLTVYEVNASSIDSAAFAANGFVYGNGPVAHLKLKCEMLFMRDWTKLLMPVDVKKRLGVPITEPGQTPQAAAQ